MKASPTLASNLQMVLTDLIELHMQGKQAHWNIVGTNFRDLHLQLDEIIEVPGSLPTTLPNACAPSTPSRTAAATRSPADTRLDEFPAGLTSTKDAVKLVTARLERTVQTMRDVHDEVDEEDPTSADLLHAVIERLEQLAWMVNAETMTPAGRRHRAG